MSRTVDQRVVEMKFDNKQFETAVNQSRQSIDLLNKDLSLLEGAKSLANLDKAISGIDFTHMSKSLDRIRDSFSALGTVGRSIINKLTTDAMNNFTAACNRAETAVEGVFKKIYEKGYNRASNLESSAFQLEGMLKRSYKDADMAAEVQQKLSKIINDSVTDTAYGLDQASVAASTLAATYGTTEDGLNKINRTLKAISGVAGQTGADYQQVADIFSDAAGKGVAMGDELNRMALLGLNAEEEIARYANDHLTIQKQLNKYLKKNGKISASDVRDLASKRKLSAEIFATAFEEYFEHAKEANDTLDGITSNIGAAMGRLGALFIQPLIENRGSLVKFLQEVKRGISDVASVFKDLKIPDNITKFFNQVLDFGRKKLDKFLDDFEKGITPLNEFFDKAATAIDNLTLILSLFDEQTNDFGKSADQTFGKYFADAFERDEKLIKEYSKGNKSYNKTIDDYKKSIKKKNKNWKDEKVQREAERKFMKNFNKEEGNSLERWRDYYKQIYKEEFTQNAKKTIKNKKLQSETIKKYLDSDTYKIKYASAAAETYYGQIQLVAKEQGKFDKIVDEVEKRKEETDIFGYDYLSNIWSGIKNVLSGIASVFKTIADVIFGAEGPLSDFFSIFTGGEEDVTESRKSLNKFSEEFKDSTEKVKEFLQSDGVKYFVKEVAKYIGIVIKVVGGVFKVIGKIITTAAPLVGKVFTIIGKIFGSFTEETEGLSILDTVVNGLCDAIEWLGNVLDGVLDIAMSVVDWLKENGVFDFLGGILGKVKEFGTYIFDNWPTIWDTVTGKLKEFKDWISDKIQPVIETIKPIFDDLVEKIKDLTDGFIDLKNPLDTVKKLFGFTSEESTNITDGLTETNTALGKVKDTAKEVKDNISEAFSGGVGVGGVGGFVKGRMGSLLNMPDLPDVSELQQTSEEAKKTGGVVSGVIGNIEKLKEGLEGKKKKQAKNKKKGPIASVLEWIANFISNIKTKIFAGVTPETLKKDLEFVGKIFIVLAGFFLAGRITATVKEAFNGITDFAMAVNGGYDAKTMRREALANVFKSVALVLGVIIAGVIAMAAVITWLGSLDDKVFWQGMIGFVTIAIVMLGFIALISIFSKSMKGNYRVKGWDNLKVGLLKVPVGKEKFDTKVANESAFLPLLGIAACIAVFSLGVLAIAGAIRMLGSMNEGQLVRGMIAFVAIGGVIFALIAVVFVMLKRILGLDGKSAASIAKRSGASKSDVHFNPFTDSSKAKADPFGSSGDMDKLGSGKMSTGIAMVLFGVAAVIQVFASAVVKIAAAMKLISMLPESDINRTIPIFIGIAVALIGLVALVFFFLNKMLKNGNQYESDVGISKALAPILAAVALILYAFAVAVKKIAKAIANLAILSTMGVDMDKAAIIIGIIGAGLIALVAIVMVFAWLIFKQGKANLNWKKVLVVFAGVAAIILVVGITMRLIAGGIVNIAKAFDGLSKSKIEQITILMTVVMLCITAIIAILIGGVLLYANKASGSIGKLVIFFAGIATVLAVVGGMIVALGYAASLMKDVDSETMKWLAISLGILGIIIGGLLIFAAFAGKAPGIMKGVLAASIIMSALGGLFVMIGVAAILIGKGVDAFGDGIKKFQEAIDRFADMDDKKISKGAKKIGFSIKALLEGVIDAIIEFGDSIGGKKDALTGAITKILDVIQGAITTFLTTLQGNIFERLTILIDQLDTFTAQNGPKLIKIFQRLENILWFGILEPFFYDLKTYIWGEITGLIDYLSDEKNVKELADKFNNMIISIITGVGKSLQENRTKLVHAVQNLIYEVINFIFEFFGLEPVLEVDWDVDNHPEDANLDEAGESIPKEVGKGIKAGEDEAVSIADGFIGKVAKAIVQGISNLLLQCSDMLADFWITIFNPDVADYDKQMEQLKKDREAAYKLLDEYNDLISKGKTASTAASAVLAKTTNEQQKQILEQWGIHSPSEFTTYVGKQIDQGMANGINSGKALEAVNDTTKAMQDSYKIDPPSNSFSKVISNLGDNFKKQVPKLQKIIEDSGLFDTDKFIIKPGMDLSEVTKDSKQLQKIFDSVGLSNVNAKEAIGLFDNLKSGNINKIDVTSLANGFDSANDKNGKSSSKDSNNSIGSINFTQNNYSPKSLSQIDIYRQTENLLGKQSTLNSLASAVGLTGTNY